ncbi:6-phosphogluconate dehydrogenase, C-terminal-like [Pseudocohnilembus persalinus]|uniref:6-phosphogluconate dehydrogenase, C-terminal-like n=1 Tax=Pseudocohnilembus persalinus TaxID=266149 RepID=A0A0V0QQZ1_PSEPJ|nr:6-phosphogluconate dehydrogenase, C-terminal-like [Pseudocohnilembus persalinus]|eukprot:KRX04703.1 6-phosphogluconate dehydrogenase, C-terminal-like [Pseudocohnilembus persalinus]
MNTQEVTQICVCGGGNGSHVTVAQVGSKSNFKVNLYTRKPEQWKDQITGITKNSIWEHKGDYIGKINVKSSDPSQLGKGTKLWIIGGPAHVHETILRQIAPYIEANSFVGTLFAQGGFDWMAKSVLGDRIQKENITVFGLLNIPWLCKIKEYGNEVRIIGPKTGLYTALTPQGKENKEELTSLLERMFEIPVIIVPNFLSLTLTPSNQIIHPGRVYGVFSQWDGKQVFNPKDVPLFYEDMDDFSANMLELLDADIQNIKAAILKKFPNFDLDNVLPLKDRIIKQYGVQVGDKTNMRTTFSTNKGYATVAIPMKQVEGGVIPNTDARIFWEDVPYGLCILHDMGEKVGIQTPAVDKMIYWHQKFMGREYLIEGKLNPEFINQTGCPTRYGFKTIEEIISYSSQTTGSPKL